MNITSWNSSQPTLAFYLHPQVELAETILADARKKGMFKDERLRQYIMSVVCSDEFQQDPAGHLIFLLAERGIGRACMNDWVYEFIIQRIPGFAESAGSHEQLKKVAVNYFNGYQNADLMMKYFEQSLKNEQFQKELNQAIDGLRNKIHDIEKPFRKAFNIFNFSKELKPFDHQDDDEYPQ